MPHLRPPLDRVLTTPRLRLRPPEAGDRDAIVAGVGDLAVARMVARIPHPYGPGDAEAWLARMAVARAARTEVPFMIECNGAVIGAVALHGYKDGGTVSSFGYWLSRLYWGHGYATEAARALLALAFDELGVARVPARVFVENAASWNVQRKLGFEIVGRGRGFCLARGEVVDDLGTILHRERFVRQPP